MGCTSSKAFKGEGHRLGTAVTASTTSPPNTGGQRIVPTTAVSQQPTIKPTKQTRGDGSDDKMRSAAARAAEQRAESVSPAIERSPANQRGPHKTFALWSSHSRISYSKYEEGRTLRTQTPESSLTSCRNKIGRRRYLPSRKGMSDLLCVHGAISCSDRLT